jgi:hypothetical protein
MNNLHHCELVHTATCQTTVAQVIMHISSPLQPIFPKHSQDWAMWPGESKGISSALLTTQSMLPPHESILLTTTLSPVHLLLCWRSWLPCMGLSHCHPITFVQSFWNPNCIAKGHILHSYNCVNRQIQFYTLEPSLLLLEQERGKRQVKDPSIGFLKHKIRSLPSAVAYTYNPNYSGGWDWENHGYHPI